MEIKLKDIIDLDYFISMDDALDSQEEIQTRAVKDRNIYNRCRNTVQNENALLLEWLVFRRQEFFEKSGKKEIVLLPGTVFSILYSWISYSMALSGCVFGISLAYSFLAYHGNRPINVTVFIAFFIIFPVLLMFFPLILMVHKVLWRGKKANWFHKSILHTVILFLFLDVLPKLLKKAGGSVFKKNMDHLEYTASLIQMKGREYKDFFFWPVFILASVFAASFSAGALGGTFFRVVVSDMAFGWQSTLMASTARVYDLVSFIALPWSWFVPESLAHPGLEQIEGSRIILKDGLSVLATQDLVSWWPFICMGILFYAVIPRLMLIVAGVFAQKKVLQGVDFKRPRFRQLMVRMQSSVLNIDSNNTLENQAIDSSLIKDTADKPSSGSGLSLLGQNALLLASQKVYSDRAMTTIIKGIGTHLLFNVKEIIGITLDFDNDADIIRHMDQREVDQVILVHEVWQPPIRGLLYYITQIRTVIPRGIPLWILLTRDAGQEDLCVDSTDIHYDVWKKAVFKLKNPDIAVKRFIL